LRCKYEKKISWLIIRGFFFEMVTFAKGISYKLQAASYKLQATSLRLEA
jgi:hypothetical protein